MLELDLDPRRRWKLVSNLPYNVVTPLISNLLALDRPPVTMTVTVNETRAGSVGEAHYVYPVLAVKTLFLWPTPEEEAAKPQFHFGVGVGITR